MICPKCAAPDPQSLGPVRSSVDWFKCRHCLHVWPTRRSTPSADSAAAALATCRKCGRITARTIGRSSGILYVQCSVCGHTSARTD